MRAITQARVLILSTVWPERSSSAAGVRTHDLVSSLLRRDATVDFAATSAVDERSKPHVEALERLGARPHVVRPNQEAAFVETLDEVRPDVVVFDRFYVEEMFSWMVEKHTPDAMRILDMQDVHALRTWRELVVKEQLSNGGLDLELELDLGRVLSAVPPATYEPCLRELAAIHRSDLTLVCSPVELDMLTREFGVPGTRLAEAGFFSDGRRQSRRQEGHGFDTRKNLMMIGNFLHPPNKDSVIWACTDLWPAVRAQLREAGEDNVRLDVYGAYGNDQALVSKIGKPAGVNLCGWAPDLDLMEDYRLLFAPLRFGAGLKGKVVDAWEHGTPVVTSVIGSEGMALPGDAGTCWGGYGNSTKAQELVDDAVRLYTDRRAWQLAHDATAHLLHTLYDRQRNLDRIHARIDAIRADLPAHRATNYTGALLASAQLRATEYFSRWIELKNKMQT